jgi:hypothetical protein
MPLSLSPAPWFGFGTRFRFRFRSPFLFPFLFLFLFLFLFPPSLWAQDDRLSRLDPSLAARIQAQVDTAHAASLPAEPLIQKALEGRGKGAPPERIVAAVRAVRLSLLAARDVLGHGAEPLELTAAANALRAGATSETVGEMRRARPGSLKIPLDVLADLIARGIPTARAGAAVVRLVQQGTADRDLQLLRDRIDQDIRGGTAPAMALERRLVGIPPAGPPP